MTDSEQLAVDMAEIEQVMLSSAWKVIERRVGSAIDSFTEAVLVAPLAEKEALCQRVIAYKELLDLPRIIRDQFQEMKAQDTPASE